MSVIKYTINLKQTFLADIFNNLVYKFNDTTDLTLDMIIYYKIIKEDLKEPKTLEEYILTENIRKAIIERKDFIALNGDEIKLLKDLIFRTEGIIEDLKGQILSYIDSEVNS